MHVASYPIITMTSWAMIGHLAIQLITQSLYRLSFVESARKTRTGAQSLLQDVRQRQYEQAF